jgi:hypothetical protein
MVFYCRAKICSLISKRRKERRREGNHRYKFLKTLSSFSLPIPIPPNHLVVYLAWHRHGPIRADKHLDLSIRGLL